VNAVARRRAARVDQSERAWWLRIFVVLQSPKAVFTALRDDSDAAAASRQEPVLALVILAGIAGVLAAPGMGTVMDDYAVDGTDVAINVFLAGGSYGLVVYWLVGAVLFFACEYFGSRGSYRRSRHLVAYATVPLILSLLAVWPVRLALYGSDVFRSGGRDEGLGGHVFAGLELAFVAWTLAVLVIGVQAVHGWRWGKTLAASGAAAGLAGALIAVLTLILRGA
jgi:hypothetical protein